MILPIPKSFTRTDVQLPLPQELEVFVAASDSAGQLALQALRHLLAELSIHVVQGTAEHHLLNFSQQRFDHKEEYRLDITGHAATISYGDMLGARNAVVTFFQLITKNEQGYVLPSCAVSDYPDAEYRAILIDVGRKYIPLEEMKATIIQMAKAKYNTMHLHLLESGHNPLQFDHYPELNVTPLQQYSKADMQEIIAFATRFGIEIIPEIEMPAHALFITERMPQLQCKTTNVPASRWAMCAGSDATYEILENLLREVAELFPSPYIHIGTDELEFSDVEVEQRLWPTWEDCEVCQAKCKQEHLEGKRELFYYFIRSIHGIVTKLGKKMMMWNDGIDISTSPDLPRDIRIHFWRVAGEGRGPVEGCSMQRFLEEGFQVVNSHYPDTYLDLYIEEDKLLKWHPRSNPDSSVDVKPMIIGGELCVWEDYAHYKRTFPSAMLIFADKLWGYSEREATSSYKQALTRAVLGPDTPAGFDVFSLLGSVLLPLKNDELVHADRVEQDPAKRQAGRQLLLDIAASAPASPQANIAHLYAQCLQA